MELKYKHLTWDQVRPIWNTLLWPGRDSEPVTSMVYLGGYDMTLKQQKPVFVAMESGGDIVAVNSYVHTGSKQWRSRGLWVHPNFRNQGVAPQLLERMKQEVKGFGGDIIWTMPRKEAFRAYEKAGFVRTSPWIEQEWGTNCYAITSLRSLLEIEVEALRYKTRRIEFYNYHLRDAIEIERVTTEEARRLMKPLADQEEEDWR